MANQAKVTSLEALETLRTSLIIFMTKAHRALDDVGDEVRNTRQWLQHEKRVHWEAELRQRSKKMEQAAMELMTSKLTGHREAVQVRQSLVNKAKQSVAEAEGKLKAIKLWSQRYESVAEPVYKQLDDLRQYVEFDLPKAIAYLLNTQKTLESYTEVPAPPTTPSAKPATPQEAEPPAEA